MHQMVRAYCLVRAKTDRIREAYGKIIVLAEVKEVVPVYGEYDLIVKVETDDFRSLDRFVYNSLREIPEVETTTTMVVSGLT